MSIATTIRNQIAIMDPFALGAWGAKDLVNTGTGLRFKTSGSTRWKGYVHIILDEGKDLYRVEFLRVRKLQILKDKMIDEVFVEDLINVIDEFVG